MQYNQQQQRTITQQPIVGFNQQAQPQFANAPPPPAQPQLSQVHKAPPAGVVLVSQPHTSHQQPRPAQLPPYSATAQPPPPPQQPPIVKIQQPLTIHPVSPNTGAPLQQGGPNNHAQHQQLAPAQQQQQHIQVPPRYTQAQQSQPSLKVTVHPAPQTQQMQKTNAPPLTPSQQLLLQQQFQQQQQQELRRIQAQAASNRLQPTGGRNSQHQQPSPATGSGARSRSGGDTSSHASSSQNQEQKGEPQTRQSQINDLHGPGAIDGDAEFATAAQRTSEIKSKTPVVHPSSTDDPFTSSTQAGRQEEDFLAALIPSSGADEEFVASTGLRELVGAPLPPAPATVDTPPNTPGRHGHESVGSSSTRNNNERGEGETLVAYPREDDENPTIPATVMGQEGILSDESGMKADEEGVKLGKNTQLTTSDTILSERTETDAGQGGKYADDSSLLQNEEGGGDDEYAYQGPLTEVIRYTIEHSRRHRVEELQQLGAQRYLEEKAFLRAMRADRNLFQQPEVLASSSYWHPQGYYIYMKTNAGVHETMEKHTDHLLAKLHIPQTLAFMWPASEGVKSLAHIAWIFEHQMFGPIAQCRVHFDEDKGGLAFITYTCVGAEEVVYDLFHAQRAPFLAEDTPNRNNWKLEMAACYEDDYDEPDHLQQLADFKRETWGSLMESSCSDESDSAEVHKK